MLKLSFLRSKNFKLRSTLIYSFIIVIALTLCCISIPSYFLYRNSMIEQISSSRVDLLAQISHNIKKIQDEIVTVSDLYYHDPDLINIATANDFDSYEYILNEEVIKTLDTNVKDTLSNYKFNHKVQLICNNGYTYSSIDMESEQLYSYSKQLWYSNLMSSDDNLFWLSSLTVYGNSPTENDYFSLIRKIKNSDDETVAILIISVDERSLFNTYKDQINDNSSIYLVDQEGRIVSHPVKTMVGRVFYDMKKLDGMFQNEDVTFINKLGDEYLFSRYNLSEDNWITIEEIPLKSILDPIQKINLIIIIIAGIVALISILLSLVISSRVSKPLSNVYNSMQMASHGDFQTKFSKEGFSEARGIAIACESFVKRIVDLHSDLRSKDVEKHKLELDFLQAQINPHFLYNTLFTIKCMVDMKYNEEACTMIDSLTGILKAALGNSGQYTTIESEMDLLDQYGFILLKRYKGLFTVKFDIDTSTKDLFILHFIIQPILENSIFHGFSNIKSGGLIHVSSLLQDGQVIISVEDNGCGMDQETIKEVFNYTSNYDHIGLNNVFKRIKLHYNDDANMIIESTKGIGTKVNIILPILENPNLEEI